MDNKEKNEELRPTKMRGVVFWIGWHVLTARSESEKLSRLARKRHGANDHKSNITDW